MKDLTFTRINLRLPDDVRERLEAAASSEGLTLTQEILARLKATLRQDEALLAEAETVKGIGRQHVVHSYADLLRLYEVAVAMQGFEPVQAVEGRVDALAEELASLRQYVLRSST